MVLFDTGSPLLWMASAFTSKNNSVGGCNETPAWTPSTDLPTSGRNAEFVYGSASIQGPVYSAPVIFEGQSGDGAALALDANVVAAQVSNACGMMGTWGVDQASDSLPQMLKDSNLKGEFAVNLKMAAENTEFVPSGSITFGGQDPSVKRGEAVCVQLLPTTGGSRITPPPTSKLTKSSWWQFTLDAIKVGNKTIVETSSHEQQQGILDSGASELELPADVVHEVYKFATSLGLTSNCSKRHEMPDIVFTMNGVDFPVRGSAYYSENCTPLFKINTVDPPGFSTVGNPFFFEYYPTFSYDDKTIQIAAKSDGNYPTGGKPVPDLPKKGCQ